MVGRREAGIRYTKHYNTINQAANDLYLKGGNASIEGLSLFDTEWENIKFGQTWASAHAHNDNVIAELVSDFALNGAYILEIRQHPRDRLHWREIALNVAKLQDNHLVEAAHLVNVGIAYKDLGRVHQSVKLFKRAIRIYRKLSDKYGESAALGNLGWACVYLGQTGLAIKYHKMALELDREIDNRRGEANDLGNLGNAYHVRGLLDQAVYHHKRALLIDQEIRDRRGEGRDLCNLGSDYVLSNDIHKALECFEMALAITRETNDIQGEGTTLWNISQQQQKLGQYTQAISNAESALKIYERIGNADATQISDRIAQWRTSLESKRKV